MENNREEKILKYIKSYMLKCGVTPTIREICIGVGLKSTSSVQHYMDILASKGHIERLDRHSGRYRVKGMKYVQSV